MTKELENTECTIMDISDLITTNSLLSFSHTKANKSPHNTTYTGTEFVMSSAFTISTIDNGIDKGITFHVVTIHYHDRQPAFL